jgi:small nuclear ribonucleoprotein (snRNP)-like protein
MEAAMENKLILLSLTVVLIFVPLGRLVHAQQPARETEETAKLKSQIAKRISNKKTKVKIKLRDGKELRARIAHADENGFTVIDDRTQQPLELAYSDVVSVKGRGMSTGLKIGIIAGSALVVIAVVGVIAVKSIDPFEGGIFR